MRPFICRTTSAWPPKPAGESGSFDNARTGTANGEWINPRHENAPVTIHLDVTGGIGDVSVDRGLVLVMALADASR